jgi:hypothetical protein
MLWVIAALLSISGTLPRLQAGTGVFFACCDHQERCWSNADPSLLRPAADGSGMSAGAGGRFELQEPLSALRRALMRALGQPAGVAAALGQAARAARKAGRLPLALVALHALQAPDLRCAHFPHIHQQRALFSHLAHFSHLVHVRIGLRMPFLSDL